MTSGYQLTETAEDELQGILRYIAERDGLGRALHVHGRFEEAFGTLAAMPGIGSKRRHLTGDSVRWHTVLRWLVIYDPQASPLRVLRVIDGARELGRIVRPDD